MSAVLSGPKCIVYITEPGKPARPVGLFSDISYNLTYSAAPVDILGRYGAVEIDYTGIELVDISATGWRILDAGPHVSAAIPKWQDLLTHDYLTFTIIERGSGKVIANIEKVRPLGYSASIGTKQLTTMPVRYVGILVSDESAINSIQEDGSASSLG